MKSPVEVKICGLTSEADAGLLEKYGADYGGMVLFYPKSKRNISLELAGLLVRRLKKSDINTVAVVVSPNVSQVTEIENIGFDYIQIHGNLSEEVYNSCGINIIRAVNIWNEEADEIQELLEIYKNCDKISGLLFDAGVPGSGKTFDWDSLKGINSSGKKLFLAGGLNTANVFDAIRTVTPDVVDVSSGVEYDNADIKGKDENKVKAFMQEAKLRK